MKWILAVVILVVVAAGGAGAYWLTTKDDSDSSAASNSSNIQEASITSLLSQGKSLKCTYDVIDNGAHNTGVAYFSGNKKMYGEFANEQNGKTVTSRVIRNGDTQYVWQPDSNTGYKADVSDSNQQSQQQKSDQYDPDHKYSFSCQSWSVDNGKFTPPSSVKFTDYSALLKQAPSTSETTKPEACNAIADPNAKAACLKAVGQ